MPLKQMEEHCKYLFLSIPHLLSELAKAAKQFSMPVHTFNEDTSSLNTEQMHLQPI